MSNQFNFVPSDTKEFRDTAPSASSVFYRSYSRRKADGSRENYREAVTRAINDIADIGGFTKEQRELVIENGLSQRCLPSGRALWVAGTEWSKKPENFPGYYNCCSMHVDHVGIFGLLMELAMMGTGTGAVLEEEVVDQLPEVVRSLNVVEVIENASTAGGQENTEIKLCWYEDDIPRIVVVVGDSRQGWASAYQGLIELAMGECADGEDTPISDKANIVLDLSNVRQAGEPLKGFGGIANPIRLRLTLERVAKVLSKAVGRKLTPIECCLIIDEAASAVVAGNVRRSAGMRQFSASDIEAATVKDGLYKQNEDGSWSVDPEKEVLRMANHTRCFHSKPSYKEIEDAVTKQFYSGEGAIQYVPELIARANADLLNSPGLKKLFLQVYSEGNIEGAESLLRLRADETGRPSDDKVIAHRMERYGLNPCAEIALRDNLCVAGDTPLITADGIHEIKDLVGKKVEIWNGQEFSQVSPFQTGANEKLYRVKFNDGTYLDVTSAHKFWVKHRFMLKYEEMTTLELMNNVYTSKYSLYTEDFQIKAEGYGEENSSAYTMGLLVGDGRILANGSMELELYGDKQKCNVEAGKKHASYHKDGYSVSCTKYSCFTGISSSAIRAMKDDYKALFTVGSWNRSSILQFIAGLADSDGSNTSGNGIRIYISDYKRAEAVYLLLQKCGIKSSINLAAKQGEVTNYGIRSKDLYYLQVTNCSEIPCQRLNVSKGKLPTHKGKHQIVKDVYPLEGHHDTFCFTESKYHKGVFKGSLTGQCNLSEVNVNVIDPKDIEGQKQAFYAAGLQVAALLNHKFVPEELAYSREVDPIVGVGLTGGFDFFVHAFGVDWLDWMMQGRPKNEKFNEYTVKERDFMVMWRQAAERGVSDYCEKHGLLMPNRYTDIQPSGSKALLTGASPGWHPPKAQRFIRRITFGKHDPLVAALRDYGYNVIPAQSARDDEGNLLDDVNDPRVQEVLVEIPTEVSWANIPGCDQYDLSKLPIEGQWGLYMQFQNYYTTHNTSATLEFRENEIPVLSRLIYDNIQDDDGYVSAALLARFDANETFPRLPFEPIDKKTYDRLMAGIIAYRSTLPADVTLLDLLKQYDHPGHVLVPQDTACANAACMAKIENEEAKGLS